MATLPTDDGIALTDGGDTVDTETGTPSPGDREERPITAGTRIGRYVVQDQLGQGGMGVVYRAADPDLGRDVAIKLLWTKAKSDDSSAHDRIRLLREAKALAQLSHPNIVGVHDVGTHERSVFLAMEFVRGQTLKAWLAQERPGYRQTLDTHSERARGRVRTARVRTRISVRATPPSGRIRALSGDYHNRDCARAPVPRRFGDCV